MISLREKVVKEIEDRRENLIKGEINSIPSPYSRFKEDFLGIEQGTYYVITAFTKGAKSQFVSYTFIYKAILYAYYSKADVAVQILYFALEETPERIMQRFMSHLIYTWTNGQIRISPSNLRSSNNSKPVPQEVLDILATEEIIDILKFFESCVSFKTESTPTEIYKVCKQYAEDNGTVEYKKITYKDEFGILKEKNSFGKYTPNNPKQYTMVLIDTINLIDTEKDYNLKKSIDVLSKYLTKRLRNRYNLIPVVIQQQAFDGENTENIKMNKIRPTIANLGDSRYPARDCNICLGISSPMRCGLKEYLGYDITKFKDSIRFLEVLVNRDSELGGIVALYFDGAVCNFEELPPPTNKEDLQRVYEYIEEQKNPKQKQPGALFMCYKKQITKKKLFRINLLTIFAALLKKTITVLTTKLSKS